MEINRVTNILLIGSTGNGKSTLSNFLHGGHKFFVADSLVPVTKVCQMETFNWGNKEYRIVDTPGLNDVDDWENMIGLCESLHKLGSISCVIIVVDEDRLSDNKSVDNIKFYASLLKPLFHSGNVILVRSKMNEVSFEEQLLEGSFEDRAKKSLDKIDQILGEKNVCSHFEAMNCKIPQWSASFAKLMQEQEKNLACNAMNFNYKTLKEMKQLAIQNEPLVSNKRQLETYSPETCIFVSSILSRSRILDIALLNNPIDVRGIELPLPPVLLTKKNLVLISINESLSRMIALKNAQGSLIGATQEMLQSNLASLAEVQISLCDTIQKIEDKSGPRYSKIFARGDEIFIFREIPIQYLNIPTAQKQIIVKTSHNCSYSEGVYETKTKRLPIEIRPDSFNVLTLNGYRWVLDLSAVYSGKDEFPEELAILNTKKISLESERDALQKKLAQQGLEIEQNKAMELKFQNKYQFLLESSQFLSKSSFLVTDINKLTKILETDLRTL